MKKAVAVVVSALVVGGGFMVVPVVVLSVAGGAAASTCVDPAALTTDTGGPVRVPMAGAWRTTSEWGTRRHPVRGDVSHHFGLDFVGTSDVVAAKAGVVAKTPTTAGEGNEIVLDHGAGLTTKYKHLASRDVEIGDQVPVGSKIGTMGNTGAWSTGAHLHFEVWKSGRDIDPRAWLKVEGTSGTSPAAATGAAVAGEDGQEPIQVDWSRSSPVVSTLPVLATMPPAIGSYRGEQLVNAGYVIKAGQAMDLDARTITIGVMTAMGESSLVNVNRGDAVGPDSRGLFQQRANGAWGTYQERMNPQTAATNFFKALVKVPGYESMKPTQAAHQTQRNADPNHYTRFWQDAKQIVATLTDDPGLLAELAVDSPVAGCESVGIDSQLDLGDGGGDEIVTAAQAFVGTEYSWGGGNTDGPSRGVYTSSRLNGSDTVGFDCSGLVLYAVHKATGITLDRTAGAQGLDERGKTIARDYAQMQPGDVIAFSSTGSTLIDAFEHIGIYVGDGKMIEASRPGKPVAVTDLKGNDYYESQTWVIKRFGEK